MRKVLIFVLITGLIPSMGFGKKLATLPELLKPTSLAVDDNQFYIVEGAEVSIYSLEDFKLKSKFGKAGEGPQEFIISPIGNSLIIFPHQDSLLINSFGKFSVFTKEGKFVKEIKIKGTLQFSLYQPFMKGFAGMDAALDEKTQSMFTTLNIYDGELNKIKEIHRQEVIQRGRFEYPAVPAVFYVMGHSIIMAGREGFVINKFDAESNREVLIQREYKPIKMTEKYKNWVMEYFRTDPLIGQQYELIKKMIKFPDYFPVIQFLFAADQKIYVMTFLEKDGKYEFFVFDINGKFIKRVFLPYRYINPIFPTPSAFKNDKLYQLLEDEDTEEWELHATEIK